MDAGDLLSQVIGMRLPEAARWYAGAGVPVFPCVPDGKRPLTEHGFHDAIADTRKVTAWWQQWPGANIGIPTGPVSGMEVVDVDVHSTGSGYGPFRQAREADLVSGWAALVRTPSGGLHVYYPADPARPQPSWQAAGAHVDFRGTGGYIIAPPSMVVWPGHSRSSYELIVASGTEPTSVEATRLRDFLDPRRIVPIADARRSREPDAGRLARWVAARGAGERNRGLFWAACRLAEAGASPADIRDMLGPAAERGGLTPREINATIRSAHRTSNTRGHATVPSTGTSGEGPHREMRCDGQVLA